MYKKLIFDVYWIFNKGHFFNLIKTFSNILTIKSCFLSKYFVCC